MEETLEATIDLIDKGRTEGVSVKSLHKTAANHFMKFLRVLQSPYSSLDEIPEHEVVDSLLGLFSDYLSTRVPSIRKYNTHDNYLSAIHVMIVNKYPDKAERFQKYYARLRATVFKEYLSKSATTGSNFVDSAVEARITDKNYICKVFFVENKHEERAMVALDWLGVGRINEVITVHVTQLA